MRGTTAYTQFATWAAVDWLARHAETRGYEAGEALIQSVGNERGSRGCRVKCKNLWGPSGKNKGWEPVRIFVGEAVKGIVSRAPA